MMAQWESGRSRIDVAKDILTRLVDSLQTNEDVLLGLRVYGHRYSRQANNCQDTRLEVPFAPRNHGKITDKLREIVPKGVTPITYSIEQAAKDFPAGAGFRNILILITDGIESCGGDPCAASIELQKRGVFLKPFIIGLGLDGGKALECMGTYLDAQDANQFNRVLNQAIETTFTKTTVAVELLDGAGRPTESNISLTFKNEMTGTAVYDFVHWRDAQGRPDTVHLDPVNTYTLTINTVPSLTRTNINIVNGRHNVISVPVPQGNLLIRQENRVSTFQSVVRAKGKSVILNTQNSNESFRYLAGVYEVEILTMPRRTFEVTIEYNKTHTITIPAPGLANINTITTGYGSVFEVLADGTEAWVCHLDPQKSRHSLTLLPGTYRVAFRAAEAGGSKYTGVKRFTIESGQTVNVSVFN